jgi:GH18 family chitinase
MQKRKIHQVIICVMVMGFLSFACYVPTSQQSATQPIPIPSVGTTPSPTAVITPSQTAAATLPPTALPMPAPTSSTHLIGYFTGIHKNSLAAGIPGGLLTDIIYASIFISPEGRCVSLDPVQDQANFAALQQLKEKYPGFRILFTIGEARDLGTFSNASASAVARQTFAQSCVQFLQQNGLDGIDIDWEFPARGNQHPEERENFTAMLREFRNQLDAQGKTDGQAYLLTIAAPAGQNEAMGFELDKIQPLVDWINLMTYNFYDEKSITTNLDGALYPVQADPGNKAYNDDAVVQAYLAGGIPANKLMLGVNFYGNAWKGVPAEQNGLYQTHEGPFDDPNVPQGTWNIEGKISYQLLQKYYLSAPGWNTYWQEEAQTSWSYNGDQGVFVTHENVQSLTAKADYVTVKQLGGVMIWQIGADDSDNTLLKALAARLLP